MTLRTGDVNADGAVNNTDLKQIRMNLGRGLVNADNAPFPDCDPTTAIKIEGCKQIPGLAENNSSSISFTVE